jgi:hypothetical protein
VDIEFTSDEDYNIKKKKIINSIKRCVFINTYFFWLSGNWEKIIDKMEMIYFKRLAKRFILEEYDKNANP